MERVRGEQDVQPSVCGRVECRHDMVSVGAVIWRVEVSGGGKGMGRWGTAWGRGGMSSPVLIVHRISYNCLWTCARCLSAALLRPLCKSCLSCLSCRARLNKGGRRRKEDDPRRNNDWCSEVSAFPAFWSCGGFPRRGVPCYLVAYNDLYREPTFRRPSCAARDTQRMHTTYRTVYSAPSASEPCPWDACLPTSGTRYRPTPVALNLPPTGVASPRPCRDGLNAPEWDR
jgi:hypothetical protein